MDADNNGRTKRLGPIVGCLRRGLGSTEQGVPASVGRMAGGLAGSSHVR